jgi:cold-inducible RNA-binding protein
VSLFDLCVTCITVTELKIFAAGISFSSTEETLTQAFSQYGQVLKVDVIMDKIRCRPKGFAYVTFSSKEEAEKALLELNAQV